MSEDKTGLSLATKLSKIGNEVGAIKKGAINTQQGYMYIEYGEVASRIRALFDKYQVAFIPEVESYTFDQVKNSKGNLGYHYILKMKFTIVNGENTDEKIEKYWLGESMDYGDKGINKAETSAVKYFLMRLFNVSEKGEAEADKETPTAVSDDWQKKANQKFAKPIAKNYQVKKMPPKSTGKAVAMASDKQIGFLKKLMEDCGCDEPTIANGMDKAKNATSGEVSNWIKYYQKKIDAAKTQDVIPTAEEVDELAG